ncbi:MAG: hypothetical protein JO327_00910 [Nitrososphaeraceae archaeon]|nr:hypothetical protein [Nitrososphaeraceae archaeon]
MTLFIFFVFDTVFRIEERKHPTATTKKPAIEFINDIFNPVERIERCLTEIARYRYLQFLSLYLVLVFPA